MTKKDNRELLRHIPSISKFMESDAGKKLIDRFGHGIVKYTLRDILDAVRKDILSAELTSLPSMEELAFTIDVELRRIIDPAGRKAVNATGILLHTALGRAPYADNARDALLDKNPQEKKIKINLYDKANDIILEIEDTAGGIPQHLIEKIFDPYFSTKSEKNGTGLGLYMSKMIIVDKLNGDLRVKNTDQGALFTISLQKL